MARTFSFLLKIQLPTYGKLITILSNVDGGGARRIIPRTIFYQLEKELQVLDDEPEARLAHNLDVIAGRSSGGLMTVMLTAPNEQNRPLFATKDIKKFYLHNCPYIFPQRRGIFTSLMVIPTFDIKKLLHHKMFSRHQCSHSNTLNKIQSKPTEEPQQLSDETTTTPSEKSVNNLIDGLPVTAEAQHVLGGTPSTGKIPKQAVIDSTPATPSKKNTNPIDGLPPITEAQHLSDGTPDSISKNPNSPTIPSKKNTNPIDGLPPTTNAQKLSDEILDTNKNPKPAATDSTTIPAIPLIPSNLTLPENFQMSINIGTTITVNYYGK